MMHRYIFFALLLCVSLAVIAKPETDLSLADKHGANIWVPSWKAASPMTIARAGSASAFYGNRIYMIGGVDGANFLSTVESATVNADGSLSDWVVISDMPAARGFMSAVVYAKRLYVVGGGNGPYGKKLLRSVISAPILKEGLLGKWRTEKNQMLTPRRCAKLIVKGDKLHVLGGYGGALLDTVETAQFSNDGQLLPWSMQKNRMTMPRYVNEVKKVDDYALVIGGHHPSKGKGVRDVEYADLNKSTITWRRSMSMEAGRYAFASAAHEKFLYVFGGISGTEYLNSSEKLFINNEIESNKWAKSTNLPENMANFTTMVVGDYIYLVGGSTRYSYMQNVWVATFNKSGDIGYYGTQHELDAVNVTQKTKKNVTRLPNSGIILESIATDGYTYMRVSTKGKEIWLAAPKMTVSVKSKVRFSEGVYMSNFRSKSLNRTFAAVLFVGTVVVED